MKNWKGVMKLLQNKIRYSSAIVVAIIYVSFIAAVLKIDNPAIKIFVTIGINVAILFIKVNLAALLYGIITRNCSDAD